MIRNLVFLAAILGCTISAPITTGKEMMDFIEKNNKIKNDLLTAKEQDSVTELFTEKNITSKKEAIATLKLELPAIYAKMEQFLTEDIRKIEALPVKAKEFIEYVEQKGHISVPTAYTDKNIDEYLIAVVNKYDTLSAQDVVELKKYNPSYDFMCGEGGQYRTILKHKNLNKIVY